MDITNYTKEFNVPQSNEYNGTHAAIFPKNLFCVIDGSTSSCKTNLIVN